MFHVLVFVTLFFSNLCQGSKLLNDGQLPIQSISSNSHYIDSNEKLKDSIESIARIKRQAISEPCNDQKVKDSTIPLKEDWYPKYHLAPPHGWMNDPNGLIYFGDYYHAFYQFNPDAPHWGDINWGHARSKDMLTWEHLPSALAPSIKEDIDGCFSGSAVNDSGIMTLLYTGNVWLDQAEDRLLQATCLATSEDGINFTKEGKVLDAPDGVEHFRDPKVFREDDTWFMVLGARINDIGEVHLYKSSDLRNWEFEQVVATAEENMGYMWECPDFFDLDDKRVLMMSPQGMHPQGYKYRNQYQNGYFVGTWGPGEQFRIEQDFKEFDHGHDFYAAQSFLAPGNRRIVIAWMAMWEDPFPEDRQDWAGMLTLPRELKLSDDGEVLIVPVSEVLSYRQNRSQVEAKILINEDQFLEDNVRAMEVEMTWNLSNSNAEKFGLRLGSKNYSENGLYIYVDSQANRLILDRRYPYHKLSGYRSVGVAKEGLLTLRVFFDQSSVEVFVNNGRACMSSRIYPNNDQRSLSIFAHSGRAALVESQQWLLGKTN